MITNIILILFFLYIIYTRNKKYDYELHLNNGEIIKLDNKSFFYLKEELKSKSREFIITLNYSGYLMTFDRRSISYLINYKDTPDKRK